jgi:transcriptional regulator with XRE-family HTH domain
MVGEHMETLGARLKSLRKENGYTLEQVAEKLNTTKVTLSRYENNLREPKRETISQFAKLFNVSTDYLHGHTNDKFTLTNDDKIDIKNSLEKIKSELSTDETILFDGEPMCPEAIESLLAAMEIGLSLVKQRQKKDNNI